MTGAGVSLGTLGISIVVILSALGIWISFHNYVKNIFNDKLKHIDLSTLVISKKGLGNRDLIIADYFLENDITIDKTRRGNNGDVMVLKYIVNPIIDLLYNSIISFFAIFLGMCIIHIAVIGPIPDLNTLEGALLFCIVVSFLFLSVVVFILTNRYVKSKLASFKRLAHSDY